jgi:4-hydroxybenzoate polyprenyltransferase
MKWDAYWRLMRFNKPVGILLLWWPTAWALWLANNGLPNLQVLCLFLLGTIIMRAAGCVTNDIADRHIDRHVDRTKLRPLTSGEVSLTEAFLLLFLLLVVALVIVIQLPKECFYLSLIALVITFLYPLCKRFIQAPQLVLGLAFSMGIPMAYSASGAPLDGQFWGLFLINFIWIVAYDTMYAMTDKVDDLKIGVKSTAIYFGSYDRLMISMLLLIMHCLWLSLAMFYEYSVSFYVFWLIGAGILGYQSMLVYTRQPQECFKAFMMSVYYGMVMWVGLLKVV